MKIATTALFTAIAAILAPVVAQAAERFYAGVAVGVTSVSSDYAQQVVNARTSDPGGPPTDVTLGGDNRTAVRLFAGLRITPNLAVEADYADLGTLKGHALWHGVDPFFQFERFTRVEARAAGLSLVGSVPLASRLELFARAGAAYAWVDYDTHGNAFIRNPGGGGVTSFPSPKPPNLSGNGTVGLLALGLEHRFTDRWSVRAEWARYFDVGRGYELIGERGKFDLDVASVGLAWRF